MNAKGKIPYQVDFIRVGVCLVGCHQPEQGILRCLGHGISWEAGGENWRRHLVCDASYPVGWVCGSRMAVVESRLGGLRVGRRHCYKVSFDVRCGWMSCPEGELKAAWLRVGRVRDVRDSNSGTPRNAV